VRDNIIEGNIVDKTVANYYIFYWMYFGNQLANKGYLMSITESEVRASALAQLAKSPSGRLTTSQLIDCLTDRMSPTGHDAEFAPNRGDTYFSQKVRNLVSHRDIGTGLQARGLAVYNSEDESWTITDDGRTHSGS
jgi:hypothetical protein